MIKAVIFDYGGVISEGGGEFEPPERLAQNLNIPIEEARKLIATVWDYFATGKINENQLWKIIEETYGIPISATQRQIWNTWDRNMQPIPEMSRLINNLKTDGLTVGLLSNVIPPTAATIRDHGGYDAFDFVVLSCEVGVAKPDPRIYELALTKIPDIRPSEIVFIDDQERCLIPADKLGLKTILATNTQEIAATLTTFL